VSGGIAAAVLAACRSVLPSTRPLPLHEPTLGEQERRLVDECMKSGWISTAGPYVERFEAAIAKFTGAHHVVATMNGTAALHGALLVLGIGSSDEVLVPSLTFVATANAIAYSGAVPHFVDACPRTLSVDPIVLDRYLSEIAIRYRDTTENRTTGRRMSAGWRLVHDELGYNYRLPSLNAALGIAQFERLPRLLTAKRTLAARYVAAFASLTGAHFFQPSAFEESNHWLNTLILDEASADVLNEVLATLDADGIGARPAWTPMHQLPMYSDAPRMPLPVVESLARRVVNLPSSPTLVDPAP